MSTRQAESNLDELYESTLTHLEKLLEQLDMSIARLALAGGISLDGEMNINLVIRDSVQSDKESESKHEGRQVHDQLRGLFVLRYDLERRCVEQVGEQATGDLMAQAEEHLSRLGFAPGSDGIDMNQLTE